MKTSDLLTIVLCVLLLTCLLPMPYGYYQLVRLLAMIGFVYLAYRAKKLEKQTEVIIYIVLALLFQPFLKIALGRLIWNIVDIAVAIWLLYTILIKRKKHKESQSS